LLQTFCRFPQTLLRQTTGDPCIGLWIEAYCSRTSGNLFSLKECWGHPTFERWAIPIVGIEAIRPKKDTRAKIDLNEHSVRPRPQSIAGDYRRWLKII
jgi:hypothetical protein